MQIELLGGDVNEGLVRAGAVVRQFHHKPRLAAQPLRGSHDGIIAPARRIGKKLKRESISPGRRPFGQKDVVLKNGNLGPFAGERFAAAAL